jgi:WhiB family transcriptional regulator, redox-sensing transcriptional regulator
VDDPVPSSVAFLCSWRVAESIHEVLSNYQVAMQNDWATGWQHLAACRGEDAAYFFAPNYFERRSEKNGREAVAKALCSRCPVRVDCLEYALSVREGHGIWGGMNEMERRAILRERAHEAV